MRSSKWLDRIRETLNQHQAEVYTVQSLPDHKVVYWATTAEPMKVAGTFGGRTWQQAHRWMVDHIERWGTIPKY